MTTDQFLDAPSISIRGCVRPSVCPFIAPSLKRVRGASYAVHPALFSLPEDVLSLVHRSRLVAREEANFYGGIALALSLD